MKIHDGTCRGNDAGRIVGLLAGGNRELTVRDIGNRINRGTAYVRSLVEECRGLQFTARPRLIREWVVGRKINL